MAWTAARSLGLKLILCAVSFAAIAEGIPADAPLSAGAAWGGIKLMHLILGTLGAGACLLVLPQFTLRWLGATVTCGITCAAVGTPVLMYVKQLPAPMENALAVFLGVVGVYVISFIQRTAERARGNPWSLLSLLKGGPPRIEPDQPPAPKGGGQ